MKKNNDKFYTKPEIADDLIKFLNKNLDNNILYDDDLNNLIVVNNINELERVIKDEK